MANYQVDLCGQLFQFVNLGMNREMEMHPARRVQRIRTRTFLQTIDVSHASASTLTPSIQIQRRTVPMPAVGTCVVARLDIFNLTF